MGYAAYLKQLLKPLGIYTFRRGSVSGAETESIGTALDACAAELEKAEREMLLPTAETVGLARMAELFAKPPASPTIDLRRKALMALLQIGGDDFTPAAINRALSGCGIKAFVEETDTPGCVRVTFPDTAGIPAEFDQIAGIIVDIVPCHLETEFYFRYLTWLELEAKFQTWQQIEQEQYTWEKLEMAV